MPLAKTAASGKQFGETHMLTTHQTHVSAVSSGTLHHVPHRAIFGQKNAGISSHDCLKLNLLIISKIN